MKSVGVMCRRREDQSEVIGTYSLAKSRLDVCTESWQPAAAGGVPAIDCPKSAHRGTITPPPRCAAAPLHDLPQHLHPHQIGLALQTAGADTRGEHDRIALPHELRRTRAE